MARRNGSSTAEQGTHNPLAAGSSPARSTREADPHVSDPMGIFGQARVCIRGQGRLWPCFLRGEDMDIKKRCPGCERWLDISRFSKDKTSYDGLQHHCKACRRLIESASRADRRERLKASGFAGCDHGTANTYRIGCRCDDCKAAMSEYARETKKRLLAKAKCGTVKKYTYGCRCEKCKKARRGYEERLKLRKGI